jgi:hypothetical protein
MVRLKYSKRCLLDSSGLVEKKDTCDNRREIPVCDYSSAAEQAAAASILWRRRARLIASLQQS